MQKTAYEVRISDCSSDVCSSDLPLPPDNSPDTPALSVLDAILSKGESSRLYHDLVYRDQLAQSAETYLDTKQQGGALAIYAIMASGKQAADGEAALRKEVARLRDAPVTAAELAEAKNEILRSESTTVEPRPLIRSSNADFGRKQQNNKPNTR